MRHRADLSRGEGNHLMIVATDVLYRHECGIGLLVHPKVCEHQSLWSHPPVFSFPDSRQRPALRRTVERKVRTHHQPWKIIHFLFTHRVSATLTRVVLMFSFFQKMKTTRKRSLNTVRQFTQLFF